MLSALPPPPPTKSWIRLCGLPPPFWATIGFLTLGPKLDPLLDPPPPLWGGPVDSRPKIWTPPPPLSKILDPPLTSNRRWGLYELVRLEPVSLKVRPVCSAHGGGLQPFYEYGSSIDTCRWVGR